jgi:hypothetical protein
LENKFDTNHLAVEVLIFLRGFHNISLKDVNL